MPIRISRVLLSIEAFFLFFPVTAISLFFGSALILSSLKDNRNLELAIMTVVSILSLLLGWILTLVFVFGKFRVFKKIAGMGLLLSLAGVILSLMGLVVSIRNPSSEWSIFVFGCPAIVVFLHLLIEWMCRKNES